MKNIFVFIFILFQTVLAISQDKIILNSGEEINGKVLEVLMKEIKYKRFDNPNGPVFSLLKSDIIIITYENGQKETFTNDDSKQDLNGISTTTPASGQIANSNSNNQFTTYQQGRIDAKENYYGYKTPASIIAVSTVINPIFAIVPTLIVSSSKPKMKSLDMNMNSTLDYQRGYQDKAFQMKKSKVWKNYGIVSGIYVGLYVILIASVLGSI